MSNDSIDFLPTEKGKKEMKKEEKKEEITFVMAKEQEKELEITDRVSSLENKIQITEKKGKKKKSLFSFLKKIFRPKIFSEDLTKEKISKKTEPSSQPEISTGPEITLMPEKIIITQKLIKQKIIQLVIFVFLSLVVVFSLSLFADFLVGKKTKEVKLLQEELSLIEKETSRFDNFLQNIAQIERNIVYAEKLLKIHPYWTNFLAFLEKYTLPEIYYQNLSADLSGKIVLPAVAKDFSSMIKQLVVFQSADEYVEEVKFSGFNFLTQKEKEKEGEKPISFQIQLILKDKIFYSSP